MLNEVAWIWNSLSCWTQLGGYLVMFRHISLCCTISDEQFEASWLTSFHHIQSCHYHHIYHHIKCHHFVWNSIHFTLCLRFLSLLYNDYTDTTEISPLDAWDDKAWGFLSLPRMVSDCKPMNQPKVLLEGNACYYPGAYGTA